MGGEPHLAALIGAGFRAPVIVKAGQRDAALRRQRADDLATLRSMAEAAGMEVHGYALHPPLAGTADEHREEADKLARAVPPAARSTSRTSDAASYARA